MAKAVQWLLYTYLTLKFLQYFFVGRPGFDKAEPGFRERLLRGEPLLFIVACALSVPAALWTSWSFQRGYERGFEHSADCYGKLSALHNLRGVANEFDALRILRQVRAARQATSLAARALEMTPGHADKVLADKARSYAQRYSSLSRRGDHQEMRVEAGAIERCMSEPLINF
jgi:hypothetical protein